MQLIGQYHNESEADLIAAKLEEQGILTFISGRESLRLMRYRAGIFDVGLWVVLDHQYDDAIALLNDPGHTVESPLTAEEMAYLRAQASSQSSSLFNKFLMVGVPFVVVVLGALWLYVMNAGQ